MNKRSSVYWAITVVELVLAFCAVTGFALNEPESADRDALLAQANPAAHR